MKSLQYTKVAHNLCVLLLISRSHFYNTFFLHFLYKFYIYISIYTYNYLQLYNLSLKVYIHTKYIHNFMIAFIINIRLYITYMEKNPNLYMYLSPYYFCAKKLLLEKVFDNLFYHLPLEESRKHIKHIFLNTFKHTFMQTNTQL